MVITFSINDISITNVAVHVLSFCFVFVLFICFVFVVAFRLFFCFLRGGGGGGGYSPSHMQHRWWSFREKSCLHVPPTQTQSLVMSITVYNAQNL